MGILTQKDDTILYETFGEKAVLSHYGRNRIRFRSTANSEISDETWTLLPPQSVDVIITVTEEKAVMENGSIRAEIEKNGTVTYYNAENKLLLAEKWMDNRENMAPVRPARAYRHRGGNVYETDVYFKPFADEHFYGLGQDPNDCLDLKGTTSELLQKNTRVTIPFLLSSRGYGFIWNNPALGSVETVKNHTRWHMDAAAQVDYIVIAEQTPADIVRALSDVTGRAPEFPEWASGFWQSKCRYQTQEELLNVAREYKSRSLPLSVIVADFFHWTEQGDYKFDPVFWPDPKAMVEELKVMGVRLMVSIWPTVKYSSENFHAFAERNFLAFAETGGQIFLGDATLIDPTTQEARDYIWNIICKNYCDSGITSFWLDVAEPEMLPYHFDNLRLSIGNGLQVGQIYPFMYEKMFFDGLSAIGEKDVLSLSRAAWLGCQRLGALVWSGDIPSTFDSLRRQVKAGLNMTLCGIPWWTTDIGGFFGGCPSDPEFRELVVRWFQYGVFLPVTRLHGYRLWGDIPHEEIRGQLVPSGADNEIWSFGEEVYEILKNLLNLREKLRPYIHKHMARASNDGTPLMRPMFFDFPDDPICWTLEDQFMFGNDILFAPIVEMGCRSREVYLPEGYWLSYESKTEYGGGRVVSCDVPLDSVALFIRKDAEVSAALWNH